jgi:adenylate cyclase
MGKPTLPCSDAEVLSCLGKIVASPVFAQAERQKRFLAYLVDRTLSGNAQLLKGYTIGIEVFDRGAGFDPTVDAIVRVHAGHLRARLREYYASDGRSDEIRIELPKGSYVVRIAKREDESTGCRAISPEGSRVGAAPRKLASGNAPPALARIEDKVSIVVLPFANMSSDPEQEYFADGISEDLTTELSRLSRLFVISRHSAFAYKNTAKSAEEIGRELSVRYLVEGSVRRAGEQLRISTRLTDAVLGGHVWAERYDRKIEDFFAVQDEVTRRIVEVLRIKLAGREAERMGARGAASVGAYEMLLRAREQAFHFSFEANEAAKAFCRTALEIDPYYAKAHAELARAYACDWVMDWTSDANVLEFALEHAHKAIVIDENLALAHAVLGFVQLWRKQGRAAIEAGRRAVELDPNNAEARMFLSLSLAASNCAEEGLFHIETALRLHPYRSTHYLYTLGLCYYLLYDYAKAITTLEQALELNPSFTPHLSLLVKLYTLTDRNDEACRARERVLNLGGRGSFPSSFFLDPELVNRAEQDRKLAWGQ